ncbi:hypothetical protein [Allostreptomyces psammosilenae]|uniref:Uncharacterized protein YukE n=1 Tax=Allostreptomyces psammosilenae TaxID=1892865 RepID=A0A853A560_9ACTN|nr:hypothetical protein [Allostreptomyces psammosilenae]NYI08004.1 uncharacterized protein YukE [Allostreptomyces psammosilenae]
MSETDPNFPALGYNPAPGSIESITQLSESLGRAASTLGEAHTILTDIAGSSSEDWQGEARDAFAQKVGELPRYLDQSQEALGEASVQLSNWKDRLAQFQDTARRYEEEAAEATRQYQTAQEDPAFALVGQYFETAEQLQQAQDQIDAANATLARRQAELQDVIDRARQLFEDHQEEAGRVADVLREYADRAPDAGFWEGVGDFFGNMGEAIKDWATENAGLLQAIGDWASLGSTILGIASLATLWFPPLSGALALASAGLALTAVGTKSLAKLGGANIGWGQIGLDALGAVPFAKFATPLITGSVRIGSRATATGIEAGQAGNLLRQGHNVSQGGTSLLQRGMNIFTRGNPTVSSYVVTPGAGSSRFGLAFDNMVTSTIIPNGIGQTLVAQPTARGVQALFGASGAARVTLENGSTIVDPMSWWYRGSNMARLGQGLFGKSDRAFTEEVPVV